MSLFDYYYQPAEGYIAKVVATSPVAYWPMQESSGDALDAIGSNDIAWTNGATQADSDGPTIAGVAQVAVDFDDASSQYGTSGSSLGSLGTAISVGVWVETDDNTGTDVILSRNAGGSDYSFAFYWDGTQIRWFLLQSDGNTHAYADWTGHSNGTWMGIIGTFDDTAGGDIFTSSSPTSSVASTGSEIGSWNHGASSVLNIARNTSSYVDGRICHVALWNSIVSDAVKTTFLTGA